MSIRVKCEECGVALKIKDELAGKKGNCPQCKAPLQIPARNAPEADGSDGTGQQAEPDEVSEEDAIFGKGFFDAAPTPQRPRTLDLSSDADDAPAAKTPPRDKPARKPAAADSTAAAPQTTENAANIAGSLLSKTGKKNRQDADVEDDSEKVEYDFTEIKYLLKTRVLPVAAAIFLVAPLLYWVIDSAMGKSGGLPPLAEVSGTVTVNGAPFPAQVIFFPADTKTEGSGSMAQCNPDGTYEVFYNADAKGAVIGVNTVRIMAGPDQFSETREVVDGPNEFNFDLQTQ